VQVLANRAERAVGGTGAVAGTDKHHYAKRMVDKYKGMYKDRTELEAESSWIGHNPADHGERGSVRIDVYDRNAKKAYDYKFCANPPCLSNRQVNRTMREGPRGLTGVQEVNPK
jgi:hypothetical protein